jgi:hypothetical protein
MWIEIKKRLVNLHNIIQIRTFKLDPTTIGIEFLFSEEAIQETEINQSHEVCFFYDSLEEATEVYNKIRDYIVGNQPILSID